jgi:hypothetical protein
MLASGTEADRAEQEPARAAAQERLREAHGAPGEIES